MRGQGAVSTGKRTWSKSPSVRIEARPFTWDGTPIPVTTSIGTARAQLNETDDTLYERAKNALLSAKETGRNRVVEG